MTLSRCFFIILCQKLNEDFAYTYVNKITMINQTDFLFSLADKKKSRLLLSLNHTAPFVSAGKDDTLYSTKTTPFYLSFRKELSDMRLLKIEAMQNDRIVRFTFRGTNETYHTIHRYLYFEAIPNRANIILTDENNMILLVFYPTSILAPRILDKGFPYVLPDAKDENPLSIFSKQEKEMILRLKNTHNIDEKIIRDEILKKNTFYQSDDQFTVLPLDKNAKECGYDALFYHYQKTMQENRKLDFYKDVIRIIDSKIRISNRKIQKIEQDLLDANSHLTDREIADMLLTYREDVLYKDGIGSVQGISFPYDIQKNINQNANQYYKQYQKAKKSIQILTEQLEQTKLDIAYYQTLKKQISLANDEDFACIEDELSKLSNKKSNKKPIKEEAKRPYYIEVDGFRICFGKNNLQNDYLTFTIAQKNDYFFHVANMPGSHVVILSNNPSKEAIQTATEIALYLSQLESGDVRIADKKDVKKLGKPGLVSLQTYQTIHLNFIRKETIDLLKKAKRLSRK